VAGAEHNRLITQAAREILRPQGLFQKGTSRIWIDDNGWFLTLVEFQPSSWEKGTYLNVGACYLWNRQDHLSFDMGYREKGFVSFQQDPEGFPDAVRALTAHALKRVLDYRALRRLPCAKEVLLGQNGRGAHSRELYDKLMICGLTEDDPLSKRYFEALSRDIQHSQLGYDLAYRRELEQIQSLVPCPGDFRAYILGKIAAQRDFWRARPSMKKLSAHLPD